MADETIHQDKVSSDLYGLPEELLRHSLLLFPENEDPADIAEIVAVSEASEDVKGNDASAPDGLTIEDDPEPTYYQHVKREIASYLRGRISASDRLRKTQRSKEVARGLNFNPEPTTKRPPDRKKAARALNCSKYKVDSTIPPQQSQVEISPAVKKNSSSLSLKSIQSERNQRGQFSVSQVLKYLGPLEIPFKVKERPASKPRELKPQVSSLQPAVKKKEALEPAKDTFLDCDARSAQVWSGLQICPNVITTQPIKRKVQNRENKSLLDLAYDRKFSMELLPSKKVKGLMGGMDMEMII